MAERAVSLVFMGFLENALTERGDVYYIKTFRNLLETGGIHMLKSPCLSCDRASEDKNKCLENCEKLREYQEMILKQGIYATM